MTKDTTNLNKRKSTFFTSGLKMLLRQKTLFKLITDECGVIEPGKFFVSLPGQCGIHDTPLLGSELFQMVSSGLLTIDQYVGIDRELSIIKANKRVAPAAHWHPGTWSSLIEPILTMYPAQVIHLDTCSTHKTNLPELIKTLKVVNKLYASEKVVICYNGVSSFRQWKSLLEDDVKNNALFSQLIADGNWDIKDFVSYTSNATTMTVMPLVKRVVASEPQSTPLEDCIDDKEAETNQSAT